MTLGLLQCDHVDDDLRHISGDYSDMFQRWLPGHWRIFDLTAGQFPDPHECDAFVGTGSYRSVYDDVPWIHRFADLVRALHQHRRPFVGVCFGHQMIAHALGGRVEKTVRGWGVGVHEFSLASREFWMAPPLDRISVLMSCRDQVEQLPQGAVTLAGNQHAPVGMFRLGTLLGIQGHPEWVPEYADALLAGRIERIGADQVAAARRTLSRDRNSAELSSWAANFLAQAANAPG